MMISKNQYLHGFGFIVILLALVRCIFPSVAGSLNQQDEITQGHEDSLSTDSVVPPVKLAVTPQQTMEEIASLERPERKDMSEVNGKPHPVVGVLSYSKAFPDSNDVQYAVATRLGVSSVSNREEAEKRKAELVYMAASPYYHVDPLKNSIPYLVPRAAVLLNDIGRNFFDSLYVKHIPLHQFIVTSVLRSEEDLEKLKQVNHNVSDNSCHLYGTTFDIGYNRYKTVEDPDGPHKRLVRDDTLKWVLSEVLRDLREQERCYVKYERKQGCFHITVR
ncbi:MAG: hypothetical protein J6Y97_14165 [Prevotella sp.]|nr:hypothetical protein [Prevotella sp.]